MEEPYLRFDDRPLFVFTCTWGRFSGDILCIYLGHTYSYTAARWSEFCFRIFPFLFANRVVLLPVAWARASVSDSGEKHNNVTLTVSLLPDDFGPYIVLYIYQTKMITHYYITNMWVYICMHVENVQTQGQALDICDQIFAMKRLEKSLFYFFHLNRNHIHIIDSLAKCGIRVRYILPYPRWRSSFQ